MTLKTLSAALQLLELFTVDRPAWGVREMAKASGMHHAVVHRMLTTMTARGFLVQDPQTSKYILGLRFLELGQQVGARLNLADVIKPAMDRLAEEAGETVFLTLLDSRQGVCFEIAECSNTIKYSIDVGTRFDLTLGANAKVILAHMSPEDQREILSLAYPPDTPEFETKEAELTAIRKQGYAHTRGEFDKNTFGVAVPLFSPSREIIGSLGIAGLLFRSTPETVQRHASLLLAQQNVVQQALNSISTVQRR